MKNINILKHPFNIWNIWNNYADGRHNYVVSELSKEVSVFLSYYGTIYLMCTIADYSTRLSQK